MEHLYHEQVNITRELIPEDTTHIVRIATDFQSEIQIRKEFFPGEPPLGGLTREASAKSVLGMLSLKLQRGDNIELIAYGLDGRAATDAILDFLKGA